MVAQLGCSVSATVGAKEWQLETPFAHCPCLNARWLKAVTATVVCGISRYVEYLRIQKVITLRAVHDIAWGIKWFPLGRAIGAFSHTLSEM